MEDNKNPLPKGEPDEDKKDPILERIDKMEELLNNSVTKISKSVNALGYKVRTLEGVEKPQPIQKVESSETKEDDDVKPEDLAYMQKLLKKVGVVTKEELAEREIKTERQKEQELKSEAAGEFVSKYPEYNDDGKWEELNRILKTEYGVLPKTKTGIIKVLETIKRDIDGESKPKDNIEEIERGKEKNRKNLSLGSAGKSATTTSNSDRFERYKHASREDLMRLDRELEKM